MQKLLKHGDPKQVRKYAITSKEHISKKLILITENYNNIKYEFNVFMKTSYKDVAKFTLEVNKELVKKHKANTELHRLVNMICRSFTYAKKQIPEISFFYTTGSTFTNEEAKFVWAHTHCLRENVNVEIEFFRLFRRGEHTMRGLAKQVHLLKDMKEFTLNSKLTGKDKRYRRYTLQLCLLKHVLGRWIG